MVSATDTADVIVIGDGLIGLSTAFALGRAGARCTVLGARRPGIASVASAGLLVPSAGRLADDLRPFFLHSLALYPRFVDDLAIHDRELRLIRGMIERVDGVDTLHPDDGAVDNVRLLAALRAAVAAHPGAAIADAAVGSLTRTADGISVQAGSAVWRARKVVLAAGAWSPTIEGLPRPLPVHPLKGQMLALAGCPIEQPVMGRDIYLVPRGEETLVGATVEVAGFDTTVTPEAVDWLQAEAIALCPDLDGSRVTRSWAGIRPATPDMLPILGPDPDLPELIYACGHAKNGVLLAPATAEAMVAWCTGRPVPRMLAPFGVARFA